MTYIGEYKGYNVYQNDEGFLEAYKSIGITAFTSKFKTAKDSKRIVSNTSDLEFFVKNYLTKKKVKPVSYNPEKDPNQTKLF